MKNRSLHLTLLLATLALSSVASAASDYYAGANYAKTTYTEAGFQDVEPTALIGRLGYLANKNFAIEGRLGVGLSDDSLLVTGQPLSLEIDSMIALLGLLRAPLSSNAVVYGFAGFSRIELSTSNALFESSNSGSESGFSLGIGADYALTQKIAINAEYASYLDKSTFELDALSVGVKISF